MSDDPLQVRCGRCLCGDVQFTVAGDPIYVFHCHCEECRRNMGAAVATFAGFRVKGIFRWTDKVPTAFCSAPGVRRSFCNRCGTPMAYEADRYPDEIHLSISAFDDPGSLPPEFHVHTKHRIAWFETADTLPRFTGSSVDKDA